MKYSKRAIAVLVVIAIVIILTGSWLYFSIQNIKPTNNTTTVVLKEGQREGPFQVQKIYPDRIEGLEFREYPVAYYNGTPRNMSIGDTASNGCTVTLKLIEIRGDSAVFAETERTGRYECPKCLSDNTYISTPNGHVNVKELKPGMIIWTSDNFGNKQAVVIMKTTKVKTPIYHKVVHLVLKDGRELFASPGHPLSNGRILGDIKPNDLVDGSRVISAKLIPYTGGYTYDILPSGETGLYYANNILVKSTLAK